MVLESLFQAFGQAISNQVTYWILAGFFAIAILFLARLFQYPEKQAAIISIVFSVFLLEFILKAGLSPVGVKVDYGEYVIDIPYIYHTTITNGVMLFRFLGFVFDFGLFSAVGVPYFTEFMKLLPATLPAASELTKIFVLIYVNADGIVDYIFFYYFFYAILVVSSDFFGESDIPYYLGIVVAGVGVGAYAYGMALIVVILAFVVAAILFAVGMMNGVAKSAGFGAGVLALMPLGIYSYFVSDPITEYNEALPMIQKVMLFIEFGDMKSQIIFFITLIASFLLVMEIVAVGISYIYKMLSSTVRPSMIQEEWSVSYQGVAFGYTIAFAVMYALHQYSWYIFFPAAVLYNVFKAGSSSFIATAGEHVDRLDMQKGIADQVTRSMNGARPGRGEYNDVADGVIDNSGTNYVMWAIVIVVISAAGWYFLYR